MPTGVINLIIFYLLSKTMTKIFSFIIVGVIIVGGIIWWLSKSDVVMPQPDAALKDSTLPKETDTMMKDEKKTNQSGDVMIPKAGAYVEYSPAVFEQSKTTRRVLFFYASWCPECHEADANFKENLTQLPKDVTLIRVNYNDPSTDDNEKVLARQYGITYQHSFVQIDALGKALTTWNGGGMDTLISKLQ